MAVAKACEPGLEIAAMPEVAIAENDHSLTRKDNIWPTGQARRIEPIAKTDGPERLPKKHLRLRRCLLARSACCATRICRSWTKPDKRWCSPRCHG
jgi:hypothetical protein